MTYESYSVGGFSVSGRVVGRKGFYKEAEAREYMQYMIKSANLASIDLYGWTGEKDSDGVPMCEEIDGWMR